MARTLRTLGWAGGLLALAAVLYALQVTIDQTRRGQAPTRLQYFPSGEQLRVLALGYREAMADFVWLQAIQYLGGTDGWPRTDLTFYRLVDAVTTLDPRYEFVYLAGGVVLTRYGRQIDESNRLLLKGLRNLGPALKENPFGWWIPFMLGYNYFFYKRDVASAASYFLLASEHPGRPGYLPLLAARLIAERDDPEVAIRFLERMHAESRDENFRKDVEAKIEELRRQQGARSQRPSGIPR